MKTLTKTRGKAKNGITVGNITNLKTYVKLRDKLIKDREYHENALRDINQALGINGIKNNGVHTGHKNDKSLRETVVDILKNHGGMNKHDLLDIVLKTGYTFRTSDPLNSLGVIIYNPKNNIKNEKGVFSLIK